LAVDLANTAGNHGDAIADLSALNDFLEGYRDLWEGVAPRPKARDLGEIKLLRDSLRGVVTAEDELTAARRLNQILSEHGAVPRVSVHSGDPHLHFEPTNTSMSDWLGAITAMGLATVLVEHGVERFGVCNASDCEDVYVDTSRNRSRQHCSNTCSTREAVAAYRRRHAES
jgi:predicted RNA-binding Zn ribbon-like protein